MAEQISEKEMDFIIEQAYQNGIDCIHRLVRAYRAQAEEIRLLKEDAHDWDGAYRERNAMREEIVKLMVEIEQLRRDKGNLMETVDRQARSIAEKVLEISTKAEEIERLRSTVRDFQQVVAQLTLRGVTEREIDDWGIGKPRLISPDEIKRKLRSKGLLIEDTSPVAQSKPTRAVGIDKAEVERFINNTELADAYPSVDYICEWLDGHGLLLDNQHKAKSQLEGVIGVNVGQFVEDDPLKVDMDPRGLICKHDGMVLAEKHNTLVDKCYELTNGLGVNMLRWEEVKLELSKLEQRIDANDRGVARSFDNVHNRLVALEQRLSQPAEQEAWPRLPDYLSPSVQAEFERIRAALGVKEQTQ